MQPLDGDLADKDSRLDRMDKVTKCWWDEMEKTLDRGWINVPV